MTRNRLGGKQLGLKLRVAGGAGRGLTGEVGDDHIRGAVNIDNLPVHTNGGILALGFIDDPPHVFVGYPAVVLVFAIGFHLALVFIADFQAGIDPVRGYDLLVINLSSIENHAAKAGSIAGSGIHAAGGNGHEGAVSSHKGIIFGAELGPDMLLDKLVIGHSGYAANQPAGQVSIGRVVIKGGVGFK